jgi:hypothetical protein
VSAVTLTLEGHQVHPGSMRSMGWLEVTPLARVIGYFPVTLTLALAYSCSKKTLQRFDVTLVDRGHPSGFMSLHWLVEKPQKIRKLKKVC